MAKSSRFPDPRSAGSNGLLCIGGDLHTDTLLDAYSHGIFPWPQEGYPLLWFSPEMRGVLDFSEVHWPRRFLKELKDTAVRVSFNQAFSEVIRHCSAVPRSHETGTWILPEMENAYIELHRKGFAHSAEAWRGDKLVGGLYGVFIEGVFSGESMFHLESNASKRCLFAMVNRLQSLGLEWMDIQMVTPVLEAFGGKYISRDEYLARLEKVHVTPGVCSIRF